MSYLYGATGTTNLAAIHEAFGAARGKLNPLVAVATVMLIAGLGFRLTAVPFHFYAPDVDYWELYDHEKDPNELRSFYGDPDYAKVTSELKTEVQRLRVELKVPEVEDPKFFGGKASGKNKKPGAIKAAQ
jgi:hypothetical protein